ncbi:MAG TPA: hypothetical protein VGG90_01850 [Candidatus Dormibacteraeota bacterium]|jgi:hypothetical protein
MNDFERELEDELHRMLDPLRATPVPSRRVNATGGAMHKFLGGIGAAVGVKVLTGFVVAAAAATVAVAATEVASTGSLNPLNWGQQVNQQVNACKASAERLGVHGIGQCVSSFARTHGDTVSDSKAKPKDTGTGDGNANGKAKGHTKVKVDHGKSSGQGSAGDAAPGAKVTEPPATQIS